ncbi:xylose isomerase [Sinomonas cellulolyticus]|uniref:Sugar phosphate isomerase/epimerase n=1 Tax=Sinomonas cellulolyticus TaxID=2801916 RepID=A0ABS1K2R7_9MICC|nr:MULTISPECIES: sugar phosphate isomerase/epimerase [Sinomonas]MBL0705961.1 sugar phosphate isomerase/epimerase [Sinomonas cellulolyticus]GHG42833.1 xylose isomerase [Sinomonas sp. KCTC 49339]
MTYSVQLYSVRDAADADLPGTIARLAEIGYTQVEPYDFVARAGELGDALAEHGMTAPTAHAPLLSADQDEIFAAAARLGIGTVIEPHVPAERWQDAEAIENTAARLNAAAKKGAEHGIRVGYHNHDWEVSSTIGDATVLEYFAGLLDPGVILEVDVYWAAVGGEDPVALLNRLGDRVAAIHLKDGPVSQDRKAQLSAGQGEIGVWRILAAAKDLDVCVVEFDDYDGDIFDALSASLHYLETGAPSASPEEPASGGESTP